MIKLKEGDKAPAFTGNDQDGRKVSLADFKGKKVVLYFYPQDLTPTCTVPVSYTHLDVYKRQTYN